MAFDEPHEAAVGGRDDEVEGLAVSARVNLILRGDRLV
jgi:hypothetical protein